jgi:hypothetical protein
MADSVKVVLNIAGHPAVAEVVGAEVLVSEVAPMNRNTATAIVHALIINDAAGAATLS